MSTAVRPTAAVASRSRLVALGIEAALVLAVLAAFVAYVAPTLDRPLLEKHAFRQTQTAYTARIYHEDGIDLLHPKVPVLGEPFEVPFEFPLFQAVASLVMEAGVADDTAMRVTGLTFFLLTALLVFGLMRHVAGPPAGVAALVAFVMTPHSIVWGRASMIEYMATAGAVGFAWATIRWRETQRPLTGGVALGAGLVGMLVKPTTAIFWILPALLYRPAREAAARPARGVRWWTAVLVVAPVVVALLWTRHADAIKAAALSTEWQTSTALREWNFGTLFQRVDPYVWDTVGKRLLPNVIGLAGLLLPFALIAGFRSPQRWFWAGLAGCAVLPLFVFTNLYFVHDYYLSALAPAFAMLIGLGFGWVWARLARRPAALGAVAFVGLLLVYGSLELGRGYWVRIHGVEDDPGAPPLAQELASVTRAEDRVAIVGLEWSPTVLYYADRRGYMIFDRVERFAYDEVHDRGYRHVLVAQPAETDLSFLSRWTWVGALGPHTYGVADDVADLPAASVLATNDASAVPPGAAPLAGELGIPCGRPVRIPSGRSGTWIRFATAPARAQVSVSDEQAPLPVRAALFVGPEVAHGGHLTIACDGTRSLVLAGAVGKR